MTSTVKTGDAPAPRTSLRNASWLREAAPLLLALVVTALVFRIASPLFLDARNISNLLGQLAPLVLIAVASTVVIVMGEIDLSLGSVAGFSGVLGAFLITDQRIPWVMAVLATLAAGAIIALGQGLIVVFGRVRSFAVTLAGFLIWYGVQVGLLGPTAERPLSTSPVAELSGARVSFTTVVTIAVVVALAVIASQWASYRRSKAMGLEVSPPVRASLVCVLAFVSVALVAAYLDGVGGLPLTTLLVLAITTAVWAMLTRTAYGRHLYAVGGNAGASRANGISVANVKLGGFVMAGMLGALAGLAIVSYTGGADSSTGAGALLLQGIGATVVGGVSLVGGRGSVWGAFGGALLLAGVQNGLALLSLNFYVVDIVQGLVVLAALLADGVLRRKLVTQ